MKANRKFVEADEAVSPVIAVILMVAITVVLAATVFVLVSDIGSNTSKNAPSMGWQDSESDDSWTVSQAPNQVPWSDFEIRASVDTLGYAVNGTAGTGDEVAAANVYESLGATGNVQGGDYIDFCGPATGATITLRHVPSNAVAHTFTFQSLVPCA